MTKFIKAILVFLGIGLIGFAVYVISPNVTGHHLSARQKEMLNLTLEWGRLAPLPDNARDILIKTEGNAFTRSFHVSFAASRQEIDAWIAASPGLYETTPREGSDHQVQFTISPGSGANAAEVTIDLQQNKVDIYVSWS